MADDVQGVTPERLRSFVERVETLTAERREVQGQIKDVLAEAKSEGFDPKTIRKLVALRAKRPHERQEEEALLETYKAAIGLA